MNNNAYLKSIQALGTIFNDDFEESWLDAQVDGYKIGLLGKAQDDKFYTCGTTMLEADKPGYAIKYRDGIIYSNRNISGENVHVTPNEATAITSNFISGYARVTTAGEGEKLLVLGNYLLPATCAKKISEIYYDCKAFLTLDPEKDFPFDPRHPNRSTGFYVYAYKNVLFHGLTEKYCSLRDDFVHAKSIEERAVIYSKAKAAAEEYQKYEPLLMKKHDELFGVDHDFSDSPIPPKDLAASLVEMIMGLANIDVNQLDALKQSVENLLQKEKYITKESYEKLQAEGKDLSLYKILPSKAESAKLYNEIFSTAKNNADVNSIQGAVSALSGIVSGNIISKTKLFLNLMTKAGAKSYNFFTSALYESFSRDLFSSLAELNCSPAKKEEFAQMLKKIYPLACFAAHDLHITYGEQIIKDFAENAIVEEGLDSQNSDDNIDDNDEDSLK